MNIILRSTIFALLIGASFPVLAQSSGRQDKKELVARGAALQTVSEEFIFTEGPAVNSQGDVFFTDQPNNRIWKYDTAGQLSVFMENAGRSNGLYFDRNDNLIACADEKNAIWKIKPDGQIDVLASTYKGARFNGPNDVWVHPNGNLYLTDPYYQRDYWAHDTPALSHQSVYLLRKDQKQAVLLDSTLIKPNGIVGTPDGKTLYVADIEAGKTYRYRINEDGSLEDKQLFVQMGSDGMTLDEQGNLYITGHGVTVFDKDGDQIAFIPVTDAWVGNICFSGSDRKTLFITASKGAYTLDMNVRGAF